MPTGYTANLEQDYNVGRWLKESVVRAFGICMSLRDEGTLDENGIKKHLKKELKEEPYHSRRLRETTAELEAAARRTDSSWETAFNKALKEEQADYARRLEEYAKKKSLHIASIGKVAALYNKAVRDKEEELIVNGLKFALDQLNQAMDFDYRSEPSKPSVLSQTAMSYKAAQIKALEWNVKYHTENLEKETTKKDDGAEMYERFVNFVNTNLKEG